MELQFSRSLHGNVKGNNAYSLEIHNWIQQMAEDDMNEALYIAGIVDLHLKALDPHKSKTNLMIFDGAKNTQNTARLFEARYTRISMIHAA